MPKFTVEHQTEKAVQDTYTFLKDFFSKGDEIKKFDPKVVCQFNDAQQICQLKGSQFKAEVQVTSQGQGSKVMVTVDLPLLLTPFKGKVQEGLLKMFKKHLS